MKGRVVTTFCPNEYVSAQEAIARAVEYWFQERFASLENTDGLEPAPKPANDLEALARVLSESPIPDALQHEFRSIAIETINRLRNLLHQGELTAFYFDHFGRCPVSRDFWATAEADGVIESGVYWPFGKPTRWHESRPNHRLFLLQSEIGLVLNEEPAKKRPLPAAKVSELVAALRRLDDLPNRAAQREALCTMPEFQEYKITDRQFREASRIAGARRAGRKSRQQS